MRKSVVLLALPILILFLSFSMQFSFAEEVVYDFEGQTVTIAFVVDPIEEYRDLVEDHHIAIDLDLRPDQAPEYLEWVEDTFNVNIEFQHRPPEVVEWLGTDIMAGDAPDIIRTQTAHLYQAIVNDYLMTLEEDSIKRNLPQEKVKPIDSYSEYMGEYYAFAHTWPQGGTGVFWNKSMFEREGLPSLYELYEDGEWTWETLHQIALELTRDTSGDGEIDQWGVSVWGNAHFRLATWLLGSNNADVFTIEDGRPVFALDRPEGEEAFEFLRSLYYEDEVVADHAQFWHEPNVGMHFTNPRGIALTNPAEDHDDEIGFVPFPLAPNAEEHKAPFRDLFVWSIPIATEHEPEALIELVYALTSYSERYMDTPFFSTDMETRNERMLEEIYGMYVYDRETMEYIQFALENMEVYVQHEEVFFPNFTELCNAIIEGEYPSTAINEVKPAVQGQLDEIF